MNFPTAPEQLEPIIVGTDLVINGRFEDLTAFTDAAHWGIYREDDVITWWIDVNDMIEGPQFDITPPQGQYNIDIDAFGAHSEIIPAAAGAEKGATNVSKFKIIDGDPATDDIIASAGHHVIDAGRRTRHVVFALEGVKLSSLQADDVLFV